jgi:nicotinamide mononucleotide (NMN) deamidase PncC
MVEDLAEKLTSRSLTVGIAEALIGGMLTSYLAARTDAARLPRGVWLHDQAQGSGLDDGPLVSAQAALQMAQGAANRSSPISP